MARPLKNNADYFSHDADMRNDPKIKAVRRRYKHTGYAVWNFLLETLSDSDFFQIEWNDLNMEILSGDFDLPTEELLEIVDYCCLLGLLTIKDGHLICEKLKCRLKPLLSKRKDKKTEFPSQKTTKIEVSDVRNTQSKVKNKKEINKEKTTNVSFVPPSLDDVSEFVREKNYQIIPESFVSFYESKGWMVGKNRMKNWKAAVTNWNARNPTDNTKNPRRYADE